MSSHTRGPRKRSRKARPARAADAGGGPVAQAPPARAARARPARIAGARSGGAAAVATTFGERPNAPWHPLPLSEILILAGAIGAAIGFSRGFGGLRLMLAGVLAVALGTVEVTLREHRSGFRSHTLLLSLLPVVAFHSATVLVVGSFTTPPPALNAGLLALDIVLFLLLFKLLRVRFLDARTRAAARR